MQGMLSGVGRGLIRGTKRGSLVCGRNSDFVICGVRQGGCLVALKSV